MMDERYVRQAVLPQLGPAGQRRLGESSALVVGCGALGSHTAEFVARSGIGRLILVDRDLVEESNLHRVSLFTPEDVGRPKAEAAADALHRVAPDVAIEAQVAQFDPDLAEKLVPAVNVVLDGLDNMETRYLVNDACVKHGVPWVYTAILATYGMTMPIVPERGPCLRCLFPSPPPQGAIPTCAEAGILGPVPGAVAAWQAVIAIQIVLGSSDLVPGRLVHLDLWAGRAETAHVDRAARCPCCGERRFEFLAHVSQAAALCGNSVQIVPRRQDPLDLTSLAARLRSLGSARIAHGVLVASLEGTAFTVFPDGRAIVKGISDLNRAQALYNQYIAS